MPIVEQGKPAFNALECLDALAFEVDEDALGILVGAAPDLIGVVFAGGDDLLGPDFGGPSQLALFDQKRRLLLRTGEDALGFLVRATDDALGLFVDALGLPNLFGNRDAQLVDQVKRSRLVDDHVARQRPVSTGRDDPFELFEQEDDIYWTCLRRTGLEF
jgi:hypothetical protein